MALILACKNLAFYHHANIAPKPRCPKMLSESGKLSIFLDIGLCGMRWLIHIPSLEKWHLWKMKFHIASVVLCHYILTPLSKINMKFSILVPFFNPCSMWRVTIIVINQSISVAGTPLQIIEPVSFVLSQTYQLYPIFFCKDPLTFTIYQINAPSKHIPWLI